jgi:hypothetical protein
MTTWLKFLGRDTPEDSLKIYIEFLSFFTSFYRFLKLELIPEIWKNMEIKKIDTPGHEPKQVHRPAA